VCFLDALFGASAVRVAGGLAFLAGAEREELAGTGFFYAPATESTRFVARCISGGTDVGAFTLDVTVLPVVHS